MKSAELKVVVFDANDVIATSGVCPKIANGVSHYYVKSVDDTYVYGDYYIKGYEPFEDPYIKSYFTDPQENKWYYNENEGDGVHFVPCTNGSHSAEDFQ